MMMMMATLVLSRGTLNRPLFRTDHASPSAVEGQEGDEGEGQEGVEDLGAFGLLAAPHRC